MKKIRIIAICDPYNARFHYNGEEVIRRNGTTPVSWVMKECSTIKEAREILWQFARETAIEKCANLSHEDNESVEYIKSMLIEEEGLTETEVNKVLSWYKGEGIYYTSTNEVMMLKGGNVYSFDVMTYIIDDNMNTINEKLTKIAAELRKVGGSTKELKNKRAELFKTLCEKKGIKYNYAGIKPHGKSCTVVEMSDRYRVFIRCGYGKYNYAPCFEVLK